MTASIADDAERRRQRQQRTRGYFADSLASQIREDQLYSSRTRFPSPLYRDRPAAFFREVLGVEPWEKQIEIMEALRDYDRVAVASGHKCGKSNVATGIALWYFCSFSDARVVLTSMTARQVDQILWRELRMLRARSGRCVRCKAEDPEGLRIARPCPHSALIEGEQGELARTGLKTPDFREIVGFTAREPEAVAGISGRNVLYILDEASGIPDEIDHAIEGNRAGGAKVLKLGNPTRNEGEFFRAFTTKRHLYHTIKMSSEQTPNVIAGELLIPGLATRDWVEEKRAEWGEQSALYKVRVQGEFALEEETRIFSLHMIEQAEQRWYETPDAGRLFIGLDPAGESGRGDETVFALRRGLKLLSLRVAKGLNEDAHLVHLLDIIATNKLPREIPVVVLDREGPIGAKVMRKLFDYREQHPQVFELTTLKSSGGAVRRPEDYDRLRDELAANLLVWFRDGGAIVEDVKLAAELHVFEWSERTIRGKWKCTPKDQIKKLLGRSPDRYDALALSAWEATSLREPRDAEREDTPPPDDHLAHERIFDPYTAARAFEGRR